MLKGWGIPAKSASLEFNYDKTSENFKLRTILQNISLVFFESIKVTKKKGKTKKLPQLGGHLKRNDS